MSRRLFEPRDWIDRGLYGLQAVFLPSTVKFAVQEGLIFAGIVCAAFWVVSTFYTVEWFLERIIRREAD